MKNNLSVRVHILFLIKILFIAQVVMGQSPTDYPMIKHVNYKGIPALAKINNIREVFKDSRGYIWLGANGGLFRYDGYEVKRFAIDDARPNDRSENVVNAIDEDKYGNIWVAINGVGLKKIDPKTEKLTQIKFVLDEKHDEIALDKEELQISSIDAVGDDIWIETVYQSFVYSQKNQKLRLNHDQFICKANLQKAWIIEVTDTTFKIMEVAEKSNILKKTFALPKIYKDGLIYIYLTTKDYIFFILDGKLGVYDVKANKLLIPNVNPDFLNNTQYNEYNDKI
ncbi:MAG TPA: two-component regulator propeller domain-containing protein, partial [Allocoleopsis sp.]